VTVTPDFRRFSTELGIQVPEIASRVVVHATGMRLARRFARRIRPMPRVRTFTTLRQTRLKIDRAIAAVALSLIGVFGALVVVTV
jgi:hypothetical protein